MGEKTNQLLADSRLAFLNQQNGKALNLALEAIKLDPKNADAYKCAGNAYMSMERYEDAAKSYQAAVKNDPNNGNRYYDLGFAYATNNRTANAMSAFAKAEELGCVPENLMQLYHILGIICFDLGRYDDALINLSKSEQLIGVDMDVLQRKAVIYGIKNDVRNGLHTANQMKLVAPSDYKGYQVAFKLLVQAKRLEAAERELTIAKKYVKPNMDYYFDAITLEVERYGQDKDKKHLENALAKLEEALKEVQPTAPELIDTYINAAELNLQLEHADQTIACLNAAQNAVEAFNNGFAVVEQVFENRSLSEYELEEMAEEDMRRIENDVGIYQLEEMVENTEPDFDGVREYFTEIPEDLEQEAERPTLELHDAEPTKENLDQIHRLYIGAYTLKKDYEQVLNYARQLQASENTQMTYIGKYTEANALKELGRPEAERRYQELIRFFRNTMIKDPTDLAAVTFRIQCCVDLGDYEQAEEVCSLLTKEIREPMLAKIREAKAGGAEV